MKKLIFLLLCIALFLASCGENTDDSKINIVATLFPQYDFAKNIAGDNADVELLLDFGADAHSYDPTPADIMKISRADLFIYTGDEMEIWAAKILNSADVKKAIDVGSLSVLDLSEHTTLLPMHEHEHEHGHSEHDTHIWTSPKNAIDMCYTIAEALCKIDSELTDTYKANCDEYCARLDSVEKELLAIKASAVRDTVYFGGSFAFRYLFNDMGIHHKSIYEGCASHAEPSLADIAQMVDMIRADCAKYVIYDSPYEQKIAESIAAEGGAEVLRLHAVHNISKAEFDAGEDYISLMQKNITVLGKALS